MKKIIIFILIIFLVVLLISFFLISRQRDKDGDGIPKIPTLSPSPTLMPLELISILPTENLSRIYLPITQIEFTFTEPVEKDSFFYQVNPFVETYVRVKGDNDKTLILSPVTIWQEGVTTITILPETTSIFEKKLSSWLVYRINTAFPEDQPQDVFDY